MKASGRERLDYLDAIRAIAALGVVFLHSDMSLMDTTHGWEQSFMRFFFLTLDPGKIGVIAFFMVSGFVIPFSFRAGLPKGEAVRNFFISRLFRLYPAYWLSMAAIYLVAHKTYHFSPNVILANLTMFQGFVGIGNMIGVYWTLQIEWMFYLLCVVFFSLGWLSQPKYLRIAFYSFLGISLVAAVVRHQTHRSVPIAASLGLSVMFLAALWRMVRIEKRFELMRDVKIAAGCLVAMIPVISILAYNFQTNERWYRYTICYWIGIGAFFLLTSKLKITYAPLTAIGRASYSLYLFADIFGIPFEYLVPSEHWPYGTLVPYILCKMAFCSVCALLVYRFLEEPAVALGKRVVKRLNSPKQGMAAPERAASEFV